MTRAFNNFSRCFVFVLAVPLTAAEPGLAAEAASAVSEQLRQLPVLAPVSNSQSAPDWLLDAQGSKAGVFQRSDHRDVVLDNGVIRRAIRLGPNAATVSLDLLRPQTGFLRAVKPEASVTIDGHSYDVGGLHGQPDGAYLLPEWVDLLTNRPGSFQLFDFRAGQPKAPFGWARKRHSANLAWPPSGAALDLAFRGPDAATSNVVVTIHYEIYDGLPVVGKWLSVSNGNPEAVTLDRFTSEELGLVEAESAVDERPTNRWRLPPVAVISDYSFGGMDPSTSSRVGQWLADPEYETQVHYSRQTPALLVCRPPIGPSARIEPGKTFESYRAWLVLGDSDNRERQGLALRKAQRALAPWITENPVMMHVRSANTKSFRAGVDQCAAVGFEMIIYTFGSGLNMENVDPAYMARIKADVDYAHSKGIEVGAYSLFSSRHIDDQNDVINPKTGKPGGAIFGSAPCLGSVWGIEYTGKLKTFIETTGLDLLEHDGPYPGDVCASTNHPGHRGLEDSQWAQWKMATELYQWCRERGVYVNAPDYYFLAGTSKSGMGYRESNWSLPRAQQIIHGRQNIFDGTWEKTPSMGWMFVPLTEYQGGGAAATLEPLHDHLADYEAHLANNFGAGVQACYRGPRLYDSPETEAVVAKWVRWFKEYRDILESDIIHLRRADGRDIDYFLHVNPGLKRCGLAMVYNPLEQAVERTIELPLYYTGLTDTALIREQEGPLRDFKLDRAYQVRFPVRIPARGRTWLVIETP
jgi:hypothetical protein